MSPVLRGFWLSLGAWIGMAVQMHQPAVAEEALTTGALLAGGLGAGALAAYAAETR